MSQVRFIVGELDRLTAQLVTAFSVNITAELIERTPVDTGWARANWVPRIGDGEVEEETADADPARVPARSAEQSAALFNLVSGDYRIDQGAVFIGNGVPYIVQLNEGSSQKAPAGFVQQAIVAGIRGAAGTVRSP